jgi:hypothetical protein
MNRRMESGELNKQTWRGVKRTVAEGRKINISEKRKKKRERNNDRN